MARNGARGPVPIGRWAGPVAARRQSGGPLEPSRRGRTLFVCVSPAHNDRKYFCRHAGEKWQPSVNCAPAANAGLQWRRQIMHNGRPAGATSGTWAPADTGAHFGHASSGRADAARHAPVARRQPPRASARLGAELINASPLAGHGRSCFACLSYVSHVSCLGVLARLGAVRPAPGRHCLRRWRLARRARANNANANANNAQLPRSTGARDQRDADGEPPARSVAPGLLGWRKRIQSINLEMPPPIENLFSISRARPFCACEPISSGLDSRHFLLPAPANKTHTHSWCTHTHHSSWWCISSQPDEHEEKIVANLNLDLNGSQMCVTGIQLS